MKKIAMSVAAATMIMGGLTGCGTDNQTGMGGNNNGANAQQMQGTNTGHRGQGPLTEMMTPDTRGRGGQFGTSRTQLNNYQTRGLGEGRQSGYLPQGNYQGNTGLDRTGVTNDTVTGEQGRPRGTQQQITDANRTGTGLFGGQGNQQGNQGTGLFGGQGNQQGNQGTGLFGGQGNQQGNQGTGLFGVQGNQRGNQGTGLFGQNQRGTGTTGIQGSQQRAGTGHSGITGNNRPGMVDEDGLLRGTARDRAGMLNQRRGHGEMNLQRQGPRHQGQSMVNQGAGPNVRTGHTGTTGQTNQGTTGQQTNQGALNYHKDYDSRTAQRIVSRVQNMNGVEDARAIVHDDEIVIGIQADNDVEQVKQKVERKVKSLVKDKEVHVVTDNDAVGRIRTMDNELRTGAAFDEIGSTFEQMLGDLGRAAQRPFERSR
ncbi:YhcN/YlaJ family sporulation lipoprotein [Bacillus solitudinis]|uniref:YhcN/YlaJ family sporulation lipoprotein n=1 Tax=Bacillus solitudinis TaxID=2014074 RepID=UPI000C25133B|nr:YhcN/YlaJ family sporulation lipoprotein [Bacillus solitudinis]